AMYNSNIAALERIMGSLRSYTDATRVRQDVETLLRQIPSLAPQSGVYTHNNGTTSTMLSLTGTIPIYYNGNQYNIPVEIWMPEAYPFAAPTCYVRPTADMMIKSGHPHVDQNGLIMLPYSTHWDSDHSLAELIGYQCSVFGTQPPVYKRPAHQPATQTYTPQYNAHPYENRMQQSTTQYPYRQSQTSQYSSSSASYNQTYSAYTPPNVDPTIKLKAEATEKIQHELQKLYKRIREEIDAQFETQRDIAHGHETLQHGQQSLTQLKGDLEQTLLNIQDTDSQVTKWLSEQENQQEMDVDEVLVPTDTLSQQQLEAYADQQAIEDALYFMDRALANGEIELAVFLKEVRKMARKQFMCVALMQKIYDTQHASATTQHVSRKCYLTNYQTMFTNIKGQSDNNENLLNDGLLTFYHHSPCYTQRDDVSGRQYAFHLVAHSKIDHQMATFQIMSQQPQPPQLGLELQNTTTLQTIVNHITNLSSEALVGLLYIISQCEPTWHMWQIDFVDEVQLDLEAMQPLTIYAIVTYMLQLGAIDPMVDLTQTIEFLPGQLYYTPLSAPPKPKDNTMFFSIDTQLVYWNYCLDFGPLNIGHVFRFNEIIAEHLNTAAKTNSKVVFYSGTNGQRRANAVCILCCWGMLYQKLDAKTAYTPFERHSFPPFHDATDFECTYDLSIKNVLDGLERGIKSNYIDANTFDVDEYQHYEKVENGDLSWVSRKFIAFAGPHNKFSNKNGQITLAPEHYIPYFKQKNVTLVVRLNDKCYDKSRFIAAGIDHLDLYYPDGTNAPMSIIKQFIEASEKTPGAVAVHCKAGLGRTGTCIGCYMMKHEQFSAREVIGWLRLCRPGSVIGPQQDFMEEIQDLMRNAATTAFITENETEEDTVKAPNSPVRNRNGEVSSILTSLGDMRKAGIKVLLPGKGLGLGRPAPKKTINPQGDYLIAQKKSNSPPQSPARSPPKSPIRTR
ncbi:dual specificity protein phosphatase, partial [Thraustotheca clavata]